MVGSWDMGVRPNYEAGAAIDEMAETLRLAGGFGVKINNDCIGRFSQRRCSENGFCRSERIVEFGMHENTRHDVGDEDTGTIGSFHQIAAATGSA